MISKRISIPILGTHGWVALAAGLCLAAPGAHARAAAVAPPSDSTATRPDSPAAPLDSTAIPRESGPPFRPVPPPAWVAVQTLPPGLRVRIGDLEAGPSPVPPTKVGAGPIVVRAFPLDGRRFESVRDGVETTLAPGETLRVFLDLRAHALLLSTPIAGVSVVEPQAGAPDSILGETPLRVAPSILERSRIRFSADGYADSLTPGALLLAMAAANEGRAAVALRPIGLPSAAHESAPGFFQRRWVQWGLLGAGALLTGTAAVVHGRADDAYDRYLAATEPDIIETEYEETKRLDRWSAGALIVGQTFFLSGFFLLVTGGTP